MPEGRKRGVPRNWGMRLSMLAGSVALFAGFWQLAARQPHPLGFGQAATPTPTDSYGVPGIGQGNPIPLPGNPHSGTGLSH